MQTFTSREMLAKLVSFDTTSRNSNLALIGFVEDYLQAHGVASQRISDESGAKANLFAVIGPPGPGGVVLSGHTDVVPVDGQPWNTDPFALAERGGRLYGRGTCDMKAFSAVALALLPEFLRAGLKRPVYLALSYDEEIGCLGVRPMIARLAQMNLKPALAVIGEPTMMRAVNAHKSIRSYVCEITGLEAHSSNVHKGVSAVMAAGELLGEIARIAAELKAAGDPSGRFDPPYSTFVANTIAGGTAQNILARHCRLSFELRALPGTDGEAVIKQFEAFALGTVLPRMQAIAPEARITITPRSHVPGLKAETHPDAMALALALAERNAFEAVSYGTEAGLFQEIGFPAIVCGPGDIAQAHQPDEFIDAGQLPACEAFMRRLMKRLAA